MRSSFEFGPWPFVLLAAGGAGATVLGAIFTAFARNTASELAMGTEDIDAYDALSSDLRRERTTGIVGLTVGVTLLVGAVGVVLFDQLDLTGPD